MNRPKTPVTLTARTRRLTAIEFQRLGDVPPEAEWFKNIRNSSTKRAYENAIKDYSSAISLNPFDYQAYENAGVLYANSGLLDQAIHCLTCAITANENYDNAYDSRGLLYFSLGQYETSLQDFNKAIELNPSFKDAYLNRGRLYSRMNKKLLAYQDFQKACSLGSLVACSIINQKKNGS